MSPTETTVRVYTHVAPLQHYPDSEPTMSVSLLIPYCCAFSEESANIKFYSLWFDRPGSEPTTYHTRDEHAKQYITDAVPLPWGSVFMLIADIAHILNIYHVQLYFCSRNHAIIIHFRVVPILFTHHACLYVGFRFI